jgi:hypothetical protein
MGAGPSEAPNGPGNNRAAEIRRWQFIEKYLRKSSGRPYNHPATFRLATEFSTRFQSNKTNTRSSPRASIGALVANQLRALVKQLRFTTVIKHYLHQLPII